MKRSYTKESYRNCQSELIIVPFIEQEENCAFSAFDSFYGNRLSNAAKQRSFRGKRNEILTAELPNGQVMIVVGLGSGPAALAWREGFAKAITVAKNRKTRTCSIYLDTLDEGELSACVEGVSLGLYTFGKYKTKGLKKEIAQIKVGVLDAKVSSSLGSKLVKRACVRSDAVVLCRDLVNEPTNTLGVTEFIARAREIAQRENLNCKVVSGSQLKKRGLELIHAVGQGAVESPALLELKYVPSRKTHKHIALVGKGVVFDTGGLCLKPAELMTEMKTDMAGAAVVLSAMTALSSLGVRHAVTAYIPLAENAIGKNALRPGDIVKSLSGQTVEIVNTDAEGRLLLADALSVAQTQRHDEIVDFATLTGACAIALGKKRGALFSDNTTIANAWLDAANRAGEFLWQLPLANELEHEIRGDVADLKNSGGRFGGTITAALFLKRFTDATKWVHIDIAGPARNIANTYLCPKGGTGFMVLTILRYLEK